MATLPIDISGKAGLVQNLGQNSRLNYSAGNGQMTAGLWNPYIRYGYLSPANISPASVTLDQTQNAPFASRVYDAVNDDFYFAEAGQQIFKGDTTTDLSLTRSIQLASSPATIRDLEVYTVNGVRKLFVMYQDAAGTAEIAISNLPYDTGTDNETYTATVAGDNIGANTSTGDFFMVTADNGFAYLFMENQVHKLDGTATTGGTNGTMTANVLLFPTSFRIVDAVDFRGFMYIALHKYTLDTHSNNPSVSPSGTPEVGVYVWDRQSTVIGTTDYYPMSGVQQICKLYISPQGTLRAIVINSEGLVEIREFTGASFKVIQRVGYAAYPVYRDAVTFLMGQTVWFAKDGSIYAHGPLMPGDPEALYRVSRIPGTSDSVNGGILLSGIGSSAVSPSLYITYSLTGGTLGNGRLTLFSQTGQISGSVQMDTTPIDTAVYLLPQMSTVEYIEVYCVPTVHSAGTTNATLKFYFNSQNTEWAAKTITQAMTSRGYFRIEVNKPYVNSVQLSVVYPGSTDISTDDFAPSYAIVHYQPSTDRG